MWPPALRTRPWCICCWSAGRILQLAWTRPRPTSTMSCCPSPMRTSRMLWKSVRSCPGMPGWRGLLLSPAITGPSHTVGQDGTVFHSFQPQEKNLTGEQKHSVLQPYAAYAPAGTPQVSLEPPPHILTLLGSPSSHSKAEASEKHFKPSPNPFTDLTPAAVTPTLHPSVSHSASTS